MSRSDETMYRQWLMLAYIPRYPRKVSVQDLNSILIGEGYSVDKRTIQRDLNKLSISFPISLDTEGRKNYWFWAEEAAIIDLPGMEPVTALAFEMAESYLVPLLPKATLDLLSPYFSKAKEVLENQSSSALHSWPEKVKVIENGPNLQKPDISKDIQQTIYQALLEEKCIKARYVAREHDKEREYLIHPLGIVSRKGIIYLICTLWDYQDIKQFVLHRFTQAEMTQLSINHSTGFSLTTYIEADKEFSYKQHQEPIELKVLFDKRTAKHLAETPLSVNQTLAEQNDGRILLTAQVIDSLELKWWLQGFGDNAEIVAPHEFRSKFVKLSQSLNAIYQ